MAYAMRKISILSIIILISCISSVTVNAESFKDNSRSSDDWWKDVMMLTIESGSGEVHILENYSPKGSVPFVSFSSPYHMDNIPLYLMETVENSVLNCTSCGEKIIYVDILYEINPKCGHGIFSYGYYCATDNTFTPELFYDQCGCWEMGVTDPHGYLEFVNEYLN